eukprot:gene24525-29832_t
MSGGVIVLTSIQTSASTSAGRGGEEALEESVIEGCHLAYNRNINGYGTVIYQGEGRSLTVSNSSFLNNGIETDTSLGALATAGNVSVVDCVFQQNAARSGGAIHCSAGCRLTILRGTFERNLGHYLGGALALSTDDEMPMLIEDAQFKQNRGNTGGAIWLSNLVTLYLRNCTFTENHASFGGAARVEFYASMHGTEVSFLNNSAGDRGGAIYLSSGTLHLEDATIRDSVSASSGGAIYMSESTANISSAWITHNQGMLQGGGIVAQQSVLVMDSSRITHNTAYSEGGGIYLQRSELTLRNSSICWNRASSGGAVGGSRHSVVAITGSDLSHNQVENFGGCLLLSDNVAVDLEHTVMRQNVVMYGYGSSIFAKISSSLMMRMCQIAWSGYHEDYSTAECTSSSAAMYMEESHTMVVESELEDNSCTALLVRGGGSATVQRTWFQHNMGRAGGALVAIDGVATNITNCSFIANEATQGGAVYADTNITLRDCVFQQNSAWQGGAMFALAGDNVMDIGSSTFSSNSAEQGAVFFLNESISSVHLESERGDRNAIYRISMDHLVYLDNVAFGGGWSVFWECLEDCGNTSMPPGCVECHAAKNVAGYATQGEGWATKALQVQVLEVQAEPVTGGSTAEITLNISDMFGQVVLIDNVTAVNVALDDEQDCVLSGVTRMYAVLGVVHFSNLIFHSVPGSSCHLVFTTFIENRELRATTTMPVRECVMGEQLVQELYCERCEKGSLSFDNSSACESCIRTDQNPDGVPGVVCHGGSSYEINSGYWLAPNAAQCPDAACLLQRIYHCPREEACSTDQARRIGHDPGSVSGLELCKGGKYDPESILCGGSEMPVCGFGFYSTYLETGLTCVQCPSKAHTFLLMGVGIVTLVLMLMAIYKLYASQTQVVDAATKEMTHGDSVQLSAIHLNKARHALNLLLGYFQVMSQLPLVISVERLPVMGPFLSWMNLVNVDMKLLQTECLMHYFGYAYNSTFWFTYWKAVVMPIIVSVLLYCVYLIAHLQHVRTARTSESDQRTEQLQQSVMTWRRERNEWERNMRSTCIGASLFLMML